MKTALITGVTGQDGSYLSELLLEKGYRVIGIKRRTSIISTDRLDHIYNNPDFIMRYGSMHDSTWMYRIISEYKPIEVYNLAAQSHVRVSFETPEETVDCIANGTLRLLESIKYIDRSIRFYQASSSEMFGDNPQNPQNEQTNLMPASPYACAKTFAHNLVRHYRKAYDMHCSSGILFNHESPRRGETFVTRKITQAAARIKLGLQDKLYLGNLNAKRDWGHAQDYVEAMWLMLQQDVPDDYVIATGKTHSVRKFLKLTFKHAGLNIEKHVFQDAKLYRPHEVPLLLGDSSKARKALRWKPKYDIKSLVKCMYQNDFKAEENKAKFSQRSIPPEAYSCFPI